LTKVNDLVDQVRPMAVIASEILSKTKPELIALVDEHYETWGKFLMQLAEATKDTKMLADVIHAAECRLAVTFANIEAPAMI
jgi:hypothetical protein